jgi:hypothetical protein
MNCNFLRHNIYTLSLVLLMLFAQTAFGRRVPGFDETPQTPVLQRPFPPTQYIPNHDFDTLHVALDLRFDWERERVIGIETMVFRPLLEDLQNIELDAANITVTSV